ncbi:hypothetical protein AURDEDRAFT_168127 [Auricularia subglabra TFB-10046 SS5]|nr:hypothetical protein AURDEDRAFT_168127 [Auricularia subglabra TFB-10046 SS5]
MAPVSPAAPVTRRQRDPIVALSTELVANAFQQLDFTDRLAVSHVSTAWRKAALANRHLWTEYCVTLRGSWDKHAKPAAAALDELLRRSSPLPFRLRCEPSVPNGIAKLVIAHVYRFEILQLGALPTASIRRRMLELDAPRLARFSCWGILASNSPLPVPARWARHLHHLDLRCPCIWASGCVFGVLLTLSIRMPEGRGFGGSIAHCFPWLVALMLDGITQATVDDMAPLPQTLISLKMHTARDIDCTALLANCTAPHLRELNIRRVGTAASVHETFRVFTRAISIPWTLQVTGAVIRLHAPQRHYEIECTDSRWLPRAPSIPACWGALRELHLPLSDYLHFLGTSALEGVFDLPALSLVGFVAGIGDDFYLACRDRILLGAPSLQCVVLARHDSESVAAVTARVLRTFTLHPLV